MNQLNQEQALNILINGVKIAQTKGAYTLDDAVTIKQAIDVFMPQDARVAPKAEEAPLPENKDKEK